MVVDGRNTPEAVDQDTSRTPSPISPSKIIEFLTKKVRQKFLVIQKWKWWDKCIDNIFSFTKYKVRRLFVGDIFNLWFLKSFSQEPLFNTFLFCLELCIWRVWRIWMRKLTTGRPRSFRWPTRFAGSRPSFGIKSHPARVRTNYCFSKLLSGKFCFFSKFQAVF